MRRAHFQVSAWKAVLDKTILNLYQYGMGGKRAKRRNHCCQLLYPRALLLHLWMSLKMKKKKLPKCAMLKDRDYDVTPYIILILSLTFTPKCVRLVGEECDVWWRWVMVGEECEVAHGVGLVGEECEVARVVGVGGKHQL